MSSTIRRVSDIPLKIHDCIIPMDAIVTDADSYAAIVGNDWLRKTKAVLDYNNNIMTIEQNGEVLKIATECNEISQHIVSIEVPNVEADEKAEEEDVAESKEEYESYDQDAQEQLFCNTQYITQEAA